ncbi:unnamed protein product, partial [Vitis vinifera]|uniref:Uncharacterized protein n=1 Tax=Vitis vinifera TaxID=29760 RepID=D7THV8_VITVI
MIISKYLHVFPQLEEVEWLDDLNNILLMRIS